MQHSDLLRLSTQIVAAHVRNNSVPLGELPSFISSVYAALDQVGAPALVSVRQEPAVPAKKSVFPSYIVCLEDGRKLKMLKRHLQTSYGMTPAEYRAKWGLPDGYPMVAPDYAAQRATLSKAIGLGRKPKVLVAAEVPVQKIAEGVRGKKAGRKKAVAPKLQADAEVST